MHFRRWRSSHTHVVPASGTNRLRRHAATWCALALAASALAVASPAAAHDGEDAHDPAGAHDPNVVLPPRSHTEASCAGKVPIVVASDARAQSDLHSAMTLAGVLSTNCVVLAGARDEPMPAAQLARLTEAAQDGFIVGGTAAVPDAKVAGHALTRIAGTDRWHTAQLVGAQARRIALGEPAEATQQRATVFTALSSGFEHSCAVRLDGTLACWGSDVEGKARAPQGAFTSVSAGGHHTCAIRTDRTIVCWGLDDEGQSTPPEGTFTAVSAGGHHTCAIRTDGTVVCWGLDDEGQSTPPAGAFAAVSAGELHTCGLVATNDMFLCWGLLEGSGSGDFVQLSAHLGTQVCVLNGDGTVTCWGAIYQGGGPASIAIPEGAISALSTGGRHACGIADGAVFCWGEDSRGQVSGGGGGNAVVIQDEDGDIVPFVAVSAGGSHTCGLTEDGAIHCWGDYRSGRTTPPTS